MTSRNMRCEPYWARVMSQGLVGCGRARKAPVRRARAVSEGELHNSQSHFTAAVHVAFVRRLEQSLLNGEKAWPRGCDRG